MSVAPFPAIGWNPDGTASGDPRVVRVVVVVPNPIQWVDCATCWAGGRILSGDRWLMCWTCLGTGSVTR